MWNNQRAFLGADSSYDEAAVVLYGAPYDSTTSFRPGARFGSRAIRDESFGLETYSPYQDKDLSCLHVFDGGDLELPFGDAQAALMQIERYAGRICAAGKIPFLLGGEHLVTLGAVRALVKLHPDLRLVHFDAHTDLREDYLGVKLSHACVIRRCWELLGDGRIAQFGIRSGDREEFAWAAEGHVSMNKFDFTGLSAAVGGMRGAPVYLTMDLDVLDPSVFPGTGTPEAGGVTFLALLEAIREVCAKANIVGLDAVELAPAYDASGVSTATACKLVRETLLALGK